MSEIKTYRDLIVWQKAIAFITNIYKVTAEFPKEEMYGLNSQMRRAAISIPSNIAEGFGRKSTGDYKRFLNISMASLFEVQTQLEITLNLKYIDQNTFDENFETSREIERMLSSLIRKLK